MEKTKPPQQHGVTVVNKPKGPTSAGCLERIKRKLGQKKIGHAGTLDPMATGVLVVLLGEGTKLADFVSGFEKTYSGEFVIGMETDSYDAEGKVLSEKGWDGISEEQVRAEIEHWQSLTEQEVPPVSAAKHKGKPLYALQRAGKEVPIKRKSITIFSSEVPLLELPRARFRVQCSAGTYIRSLVHSLGIRLGSGATLTELTREHSRPFDLGQAHELDALIEDPEGFPAKVMSVADALAHMPRITVSDAQAKLVRNGGRLRIAETTDDASLTETGTRALLLSKEETPLAVVESTPDDGAARWAILRGFVNLS